MRAPVSRPHPPSVRWPASRRPAAGRRSRPARRGASRRRRRRVPDRVGLRAGLGARRAGGELEPAQLAADEAGAREGVVLAAGEQVPGEHCELAGDGDRRDVAPAPRGDALRRTRAAARGSWRPTTPPRRARAARRPSPPWRRGRGGPGRCPTGGPSGAARGSRPAGARSGSGGCRRSPRPASRRSSTSTPGIVISRRTSSSPSDLLGDRLGRRCASSSPRKSSWRRQPSTVRRSSIGSSRAASHARPLRPKGSLTGGRPLRLRCSTAAISFLICVRRLTSPRRRETSRRSVRRALIADPDRRDQIGGQQIGQHPRVDLVGLDLRVADRAHLLGVREHDLGRRAARGSARSPARCRSPPAPPGPSAPGSARTAQARSGVVATRPAERARPPSQIATSQKSRCTSNPIDLPTSPPARHDDGRDGGQNDTYGFALAAHPGKSQGRPVTPTGSQPIRTVRPARPRSPRAPVPERPRRYAPPRTNPARLRRAFSCRYTTSRDLTRAPRQAWLRHAVGYAGTNRCTASSALFAAGAATCPAVRRAGSAL